MLLSHTELVQLVEEGTLQGVTDMDNINGTSIDIVLGPKLLIEDYPDLSCPDCGDSNSDYYTYLSVPADRLLECSSCGYKGTDKKWAKPVDFSKKEALNMKEVDCTDGYVLQPGQVCLAHSVEVFNLPMHLTAEYRLKSSQARVFLEHLHASWCDPGWNGSVLTLEFKNESQYHPLLLKAGTKCGQVMFYSHTSVPEDKSYKVRGQYNNCGTVTESKGLK